MTAPASSSDPSPTSTRSLSDGTTIPSIGLGTAPLDDDAAERAVADGLRIGYRLIDTGAVYGNETGVGRGLRRSDVPRDQVRLMTKLRGRDHGYAETLAAFDESRVRLGVDYVDLFLIHWPNPRADRYVDTWRALLRLRREGVVRSIGVSNFTAPMVERLEDETGVAPAVDQIEVHPRWPQEELRTSLTDREVATLAYSPLGRGADLLAEPVLRDIARAHGVSAAQVVLRWHLQVGTVPLPRASTSERRRENFDIFDFQLSPEEVGRVSTSLGRARTGFDPEDHEEM